VTDHPCRLRRIDGDLENPARTIRCGEPGAHIDQRRVRKTGEVEIDAARILPTGVELERLDRFTIRLTKQLLQHDHRCHHPRRD
jgi:hypothetical protein